MQVRPGLLIALLLVLAASSGCGVLPTPVTAQPSPSGSLVVSFIEVGQGNGVLVQSGSESYLLEAGKAQASGECGGKNRQAAFTKEKRLVPRQGQRRPTPCP